MSRPKHKAKSFESAGRVEKRGSKKGDTMPDTSANIYESMLRSPAFKDLNSKQKVLYLYIKSQFYGKQKPGQVKQNKEKDLYQGEDYFFFNWGLALYYELYPESSSRNFYRDMKQLETHGFIELIESGKGHKEKNIYRYSSKWIDWGK